ncbi:MAG: DNA polymerase III subunit chi [Burkholderiaceae bacterium]
MTEVAFHVNVPDPMAYTCRLIRKGYLRGLSMLVVGDARQTAQLDRLLWSMRNVDFIPHCLGSEAGPMVDCSAVVLTQGDAPERAFDALVNLKSDMSPAFSSYAKVFEVVSFEPDALEAARQRWRAYKQAGLEPLRHEVQV